MSSSISLPYVCLRALVLFPEKSADLAVGREESKRSFRAAAESFNNQLIVVAQRLAEKAENITPDDIFDVGTLCTSEASVDLDGLLRIHISGIKRTKLENFRIEDGIQIVTATPIEYSDCPVKEWQKKSREIIKSIEELSDNHSEDQQQLFDSLKSENSHNIFLSDCLKLLRKDTGLPTSKYQPFPEEPSVQQAVNKLIEREQRVLEEKDPIQQLNLLQEFCREQFSA